MPSCVIKWCKNNSKVDKKSDGISFHTLPTNFLIRDEWVAAIRLSRNDPQWQPSSSTVVCSDHFDEKDMYDTKRGLRRIHRTGYPKQKLFPPPDAYGIEILSNISPPRVPNSPVSPNVVIDSNCLELPNTSSAAVLDLSDRTKTDVGQESIFDTPRKNRLQQELTKRELYYKNTYILKIKALQQKVRRLQRRNLSLKEIIKKLKMQNIDKDSYIIKVERLE